MNKVFVSTLQAEQGYLILPCFYMIINQLIIIPQLWFDETILFVINNVTFSANL